MDKFQSVYENEFLPNLDVIDENLSDSQTTFKAYDKAIKALDKMDANAFTYGKQQQIKIFTVALNNAMTTYQQTNGIRFIY